jgi:outer membrane protein OmpA-like peptidoglycan-associated protein
MVMRLVLLPAILASAYLAIVPVCAQEAAPPSIHCTPGPFIAFAARNASAIDKNAKQVLDNIVEFATTGSCWTGEGVILSVVGHRDRDEDAAISLARAVATRDYLVAKGLSKARIEITDAGDTRPRRVRNTDIPERENSRVEILFQYFRATPARDTRPQ